MSTFTVLKEYQCDQPSHFSLLLKLGRAPFGAAGGRAETFLSEAAGRRSDGALIIGISGFGADGGTGTLSSEPRRGATAETVAGAGMYVPWFGADGRRRPFSSEPSRGPTL
jgi:hypothetical protein